MKKLLQRLSYLAMLILCQQMLAAPQVLYPADEGVSVEDNFGHDVAVSGDWAVVSAPRDLKAGTTSTGAVYLLKNTAGVWTVHSKIRPPADAPAYTAFGSLVKMRGSLMVVASMGRLFCYRLAGESWGLEAEVAVPGNNHSYADLDLDSDEAVYLSTSSFFSPTSVFCFSRSGASWSLQQTLLDPVTPTALRGFGSRIAIENGVLLVARAGNSTTAGQICEYRRVSDSWQLSRTITGPGSASADFFGTGLVMGSSRVMTFSTRLGVSSLHLYQIADSGWTLLRSFSGQATLSGTSTTALSAQKALFLSASGMTILNMSSPTASSWTLQTIPSPRAGFALTSLALSASNDAALVGSHFNFSSQYFGGVFPVGWQPQAAFGPIIRPKPSHTFGGNLSMDGGHVAVASGSFQNGDGVYSGAVSLVENTVSGWQEVKTLYPPEGIAVPSSFGTGLAVSGNRLAVSDPAGAASGGRSARVLVYEKQGASWPDQPSYVVTLPQLQGEYWSQAYSMAFAGEYLAVSENADTFTRVRVFRIGAGGSVQTLGAIERPPNSAFGSAMSIHAGQLAVCHAPMVRYAWYPQMEVLLYDLTGGAITETQAIQLPSHAGDSYSFGSSVVLKADAMMVSSGSIFGAGACFYRKQAGIWKLSSELRPPALPAVGDLRDDFDGETVLARNNTSNIEHISINPLRVLGRVDGNASSASYAMEAGVAVVGRRDSLTFTRLKSLQTMVAAESPLVEGSRETVPGGTIDLGELMVGRTQEIEIEFMNRSAGPLAVTGVRVTPRSGGNSLQETVFTPLSLPSLAKGKAIVKLNPSAAGPYELDFEVLHDDAEIGPCHFTLIHRAVTTPTPVVVNSQNEGRLVALGESTCLEPYIEGTRNYTCQWYKDGQLLRGRTGAVLPIISARSSDAGRYRLEVRAPGAAPVRTEMRLGVFDRQVSYVLAKPSQSLSFTARFWGPGIEVRWVIENQGTINPSWNVQGSHTPTLRISQAGGLAQSQPFQCGASLFLDGASVDQSHRVHVEVGVLPALSISGPREIAVNDAARLSISDNTTAAPSGSKIEVTGLPPGMRLSPLGFEITGAPTLVGDYKLAVTAENQFGRSKPIVWPLRVTAAYETPTIDYGAAPIAAGILLVPDSIPGLPEWATLVQVLSSSGTGFSGSLAFGNVRRSFAGRWTYPEGGSGERIARLRLAPFLGYRQAWINLRQSGNEPGTHPGGAAVFLELLPPSTEPMEPFPTSEAYLDPGYPNYPIQRQLLAGRYSFLLNGVPQTGFGSLLVNSTMMATAVGTLADGSGFTCSMPVTRDSTPAAGVPLVSLTHGPARLWGRITINDTGYPDVGLLGGELRMLRLPNIKSRLLPEGVDASLVVAGARYFQPTGVPFFTRADVAPEEYGRATLRMESLALETGIRFTQAGRVSVEHRSDFPVSLDVFTPTGFFTGKASFQQPVPGFDNKLTTTTLNFRGMLVPQFFRGGGFFHMPELPNPGAEPPTTSQNSPILVMPVSLE
jgi:hypothetical protein